MHTRLGSPSLFPDDLLDEDRPSGPDDSARRWWVLYTKARQEKAVARDLHAQRIPFYLPLTRHTKVYGGRKVHAEIPLFSGYVFLFATEDERTGSLRTNRISRTLKVANPEQLRFDLRQLRRLIESGAPVTIEERLSAGDRVRIKRGQLAGIEGTVVRRKGHTRLIVAVDFLQQGASLVIDDDVVEPA